MEKASGEHEPVNLQPLRRLNSDIVNAFTHDHLQRGLSSYLESEYGIDGDIMLRAFMTEQVDLPDEELFDSDPDEARAKVRIFIYSHLIPLYEDLHDTAQTEEWFPVAMLYIFNDDYHDPLFCEPDIHVPYSHCPVGSCPARYITSSLSTQIHTLSQASRIGGMTDDVLLEEQIRAMRRIRYLVSDEPILTAPQANALAGELRYNVGEAVRYNRGLTQ